ncbi:tetratricopeptide repeat protein [Kitasatospora sp. NPDC057904]|uniref:tetratricopeptide repeat protein n=1 Tax=unclassified Kitasatospora TaxID=2633591 RepID=UPI0036DC53EE
MISDERLDQAARLYDRAVFGADADAIPAADRCLDAVEADLAMARGRNLHARFLAEGVAEEGELTLFSRADELYEALGDMRGRADAQFWIGTYQQLMRGDAEAARPFFERALELAEQADDDLIRSYALRHLGILAHMAGRLAEARAWLEESTALRRKLNFRAGVAANLVGLAYIAAQEGREDDAVATLAEAERLATETESHGVLRWVADAMLKLRSTSV